jgi:hypothetical protein
LRGVLVRRRICIGLATIAVTLAAGCGSSASNTAAEEPAATATTQAAQKTTSELRFAADSFWNTVLAPDQPIDARSPAMVDELVQQVAEFGAWINYDSWSIPVYVVPDDQALVPVTHDNPNNPDLKAILRKGVPIPDDARPAEGDDRHLVIWQPGTDRMWEFWTMRREDDRWVAGHAGYLADASRSEGLFEVEGYWGATATGLAAAGGLITLKELRQGRIEHVLALGMPNNTTGRWVWPAQRTDGFADRSIIAQGTRLRLDPKLNVGALGLPPLARMIAKAAQDYGVVVRDHAGTVNFYGEAPKTDADNALYAQALQGRFPDAILADFPWDRLQVLEQGELLTWPE